ncbi:MAG: SDR family oxidoreductase [Desulfovibrionaceae bacterium]
MSQDPFLLIQVGQSEEFEHTITQEDVDAFVRLTGDDNPLHVSETFAATTTLQKPVVHGMLTASFVSTMIGTKLPGEGALWFEQSFRFLAPVRVGETIRICSKVAHKSPGQRMLVVETEIFGSGGRRVLEGEGKVKMVEPKVQEDRKAPSHEKGAVIISGAGRGIGAAIARELARQGYAVCINYRSSEGAAVVLCKDIVESGGRAITYQADISDPSAVGAMVAESSKTFGRLSGVVCNASPTVEPLGFEALTWSNFQQQLDVQLKGSFQLVHTALSDLLCEGNQGRVVIISSIYADAAPPPKIAPYVAAKAALNALIKSLAVEFGPRGLRVNGIAPGMTETAFIMNTPQKAKLLNKMQSSLRTLGTPEDVANVAGFLFSDKSLHMNGQILRVCGGTVMP